jgi:hypothetical protein
LFPSLMHPLAMIEFNLAISFFIASMLARLKD